MPYLLDTNIFNHATSGTISVVNRLNSLDESEVYLSGIVVYEVIVGGWFRLLERIDTGHAPIDEDMNLPYTREKIYANIVQSMNELLEYEILPYSDAAHKKFSEIYTKKANVQNMDWKIASHAIVLGMTLVTDNTRDFQRISEFVPELRFENWVTVASNPLSVHSATGPVNQSPSANQSTCNTRDAFVHTL